MQEAHRDVLADFKVVSSIAIFANHGLASPGFLLSLVAAASGQGLGYAIAWAGLPGRRSCPVAGGRAGRNHGFTRRREAAKFRYIDFRLDR